MANARRRKPARPVSTSRGKPFRVFISHATADKWLACVLCEKTLGKRLEAK